METPKDRLKKMTAWNVAPTLTETELDNLIAQASLVDAEGFSPLDENWTPTYDLNSAASAAWQVKAARAAALVAVDPPDSGLTTSKVFDNCIRMARMFARRSSSTVQFVA
ncbi:MAG: hypothetical protein LC730_06845 [Acidobacteria bacterium]|nr:hypothetical protein [Acidobacteriota bacterium]MCA1609154.1 hypothetical protein [Acidobacteriota bacterium]